MRYELVPKVVKEDEFWKNYFYRVNLIKQSFDLRDLEDQSPSHGNFRYLNSVSLGIVLEYNIFDSTKEFCFNYLF